MKLFGKEKEVVDLILRHSDKTGAVLAAATDVLRRTIDGQELPQGHDAKVVGRLEEEADQLLREARDLMYSGAYLPLIRADLYRLLTRVDEVANKAEDSCDVVCLQRPAIADEYHAGLRTILDLTQNCYSRLSAALRLYVDRKGDRKQMREHLDMVSEIESEVDHHARDITRRLFQSSIPRADKLHLQVLLDAISGISDAAEDAADALNLLGVKAIV